MTRNKLNSPPKVTSSSVTKTTSPSVTKSATVKSVGENFLSLYRETAKNMPDSYAWDVFKAIPSTALDNIRKLIKSSKLKVQPNLTATANYHKFAVGENSSRLFIKIYPDMFKIEGINITDIIVYSIIRNDVFVMNRFAKISPVDGYKGCSAYISNAQFENYNLNIRTVYRSLARLEDLDIIRVEQVLKKDKNSSDRKCRRITLLRDFDVYQFEEIVGMYDLSNNLQADSVYNLKQFQLEIEAFEHPDFIPARNYDDSDPFANPDTVSSHDIGDTSDGKAKKDRNRNKNKNEQKKPVTKFKNDSQTIPTLSTLTDFDESFDDMDW